MFGHRDKASQRFCKNTNTVVAVVGFAARWATAVMAVVVRLTAVAMMVADKYRSLASAHPDNPDGTMDPNTNTATHTTHVHDYGHGDAMPRSPSALRKGARQKPESPEAQATHSFSSLLPSLSSLLRFFCKPNQSIYDIKNPTLFRIKKRSAIFIIQLAATPE